eukprot:gene2365-3095_t
MRFPPTGVLEMGPSGCWGTSECMLVWGWNINAVAERDKLLGRILELEQGLEESELRSRRVDARLLQVQQDAHLKVEAARAAAGDAVVEAHRVAESKLDAGVTREEAAAMREEVMLFRGVNIELLSLEDLEVLEKEQGNRLANVQEVRAMKLRTSIQHLRTGKDVQ